MIMSLSTMCLDHVTEFYKLVCVLLHWLLECVWEIFGSNCISVKSLFGGGQIEIQFSYFVFAKRTVFKPKKIFLFRWPVTICDIMRRENLHISHTRRHSHFFSDEKQGRRCIWVWLTILGSKNVFTRVFSFSNSTHFHSKYNFNKIFIWLVFHFMIWFSNAQVIPHLWLTFFASYWAGCANLRFMSWLWLATLCY